MFPISYGFFLHSLTSNPSNLYYDTEGVTAFPNNCGDMDLQHSLALELYFKNPEFLRRVVDFAYKGYYISINNMESKYFKDKIDQSYPFSCNYRMKNVGDDALIVPKNNRLMW